jgi:TetR/AcrR family transcriptional repressor of lmrAB and yxaGH operons
MIEATARLLQHRGYHGTSLADILDASKAPRGSLYFHFPGGKDQIVLEATRASVDETTQALKEALQAGRNPAHGVRLFVEEAAGLLTDTDYTFGCPVAPVILDAAGGSEELADLCREAFEEWLGLMQAAFVEAGVPKKRAYDLAVFAESSIEGMLLIARAYRDPSPVMTVATELVRVIAAALPKRAKNGRRAAVPARAVKRS